MPKNSPVPVRTPMTGQGGTPTAPWARFFGDVAATPDQLETTQTPAASTTSSDLSVPIVLGGKTYYLRLSSTP